MTSENPEAIKRQWNKTRLQTLSMQQEQLKENIPSDVCESTFILRLCTKRREDQETKEACLLLCAITVRRRGREGVNKLRRHRCKIQVST